MILHTARYSSGSPLITTDTQAGSTGRSRFIQGAQRLKARHTPLTAVMGPPASKSLIFFNIKAPPSSTGQRLDAFSNLPYNKFVSKHFVHFYFKIEICRLQWIFFLLCSLQNRWGNLYGKGRKEEAPKQRV